ncbi:hypothetical protein SDC9_159310 [bioreactor metagenome]|uniref:Uncharacterized protein n=1 Tax=bioreactor metagenome TaxID=1076179 RepID=A0A645FDF4_9ZZZZ
MNRTAFGTGNLTHGLPFTLLGCGEQCLYTLEFLLILYGTA